MIDQYFWEYESKWGGMILAINERGAMTGLWFDGQKHFPKQLYKTDCLTDESLLENDLLIEAKNNIELQLKQYEQGLLKEFRLPMEPKGTDFQRIVWKILQEIPYGQSTTYGEISKKIASKLGRGTMSAQAVGQAVGRNPLSVIVPCHRVLGREGQLTGYAGGIDRKKALLTMEGCAFKE